jgi:hypothetical protein
MADDDAIRLLEHALFLRQHGERPPGAPPGDPEAETWRRWDRDAEKCLREYARRRVLGRLWVARCELSPEVMQAMGGEALADHLRDAHPDALIG